MESSTVGFRFKVPGNWDHDPQDAVTVWWPQPTKTMVWRWAKARGLPAQGGFRTVTSCFITTMNYRYMIYIIYIYTHCLYIIIHIYLDISYNFTIYKTIKVVYPMSHLSVIISAYIEHLSHEKARKVLKRGIAAETTTICRFKFLEILC